ncbi:MAG TPA: coproporphyrinogen III oxidase [Oligoflexus sp.]|uniref:coproporphyrinogen III oxidase n=1 Tax=Oligoflexus sp. TaxID=1971216 RepID=UPI002D810C15|nr:coproporphyrinogen III oxidase [Oligoflexus sp.]HET9240873.1 coproporphyrinogen III oxidase [Oligoflexus sp.]
MTLKLASTKTAQKAYGLVQDLQNKLVQRLDALPPHAGRTRFRPVEWLRAQGEFGGGLRYMATDEALFNRASVNISQVQYESDPTKKLGSATAISTIVHPRNPYAPSMHMHISWTEMKSGHGYWRIMGDLNPSIPNAADTATFKQMLQNASGPLFPSGQEQGEQYFHIPALGRHRGVAHFYLEEYNSGNPDADYALAKNFGERLIETYGSIIDAAIKNQNSISDAARRQQLEYHTLYFLQVLTLDRGTTSGLLVHDENDTGILGSLPSHVDRQLLDSWIPKHPPLQQKLMRALVSVLPDQAPSEVDDAVKVMIAKVTRNFYQQHPEAQELLAKGKTVPPTVTNHQS